MASSLTFEKAVEALAAFQNRGWRLGLDRMNAFVDRLGLRDYITGESRPMYFHVAGTNGKGSTTCFLQHLLHEHGFRVGACYSPYVYDVRERVQIGLDLISKDEFAACTEILLEVGRELEDTEFGGPTEFEMKTALGFLAWKRAGCNAVALETGMGGRLDATNIVDPACSIITSIGIDHQEYLGNSFAEIAAEKAGIIKPTRPVAVGALHTEALNVISGRAGEMRCELSVLGRDFDAEGINPSMRGPIQRNNAAVALQSLKLAGVEPESSLVKTALQNAFLPGRFEVRIRGDQVFILDGAHNAEAAHYLAQSLQEEYGDQDWTILLAMTEGHDAASFMAPLQPLASKILCVDNPSAGPRGRSALSLAKDIGGQAMSELKNALNSAGPFVLVTGSYYHVGRTGNFMESEK